MLKKREKLQKRQNETIKKYHGGESERENKKKLKSANKRERERNLVGVVIVFKILILQYWDASSLFFILFFCFKAPLKLVFIFIN